MSQKWWGSKIDGRILLPQLVCHMFLVAQNLLRLSTSIAIFRTSRSLLPVIFTPLTLALFSPVDSEQSSSAISTLTSVSVFLHLSATV